MSVVLDFRGYRSALNPMRTSGTASEIDFCDTESGYDTVRTIASGCFGSFGEWLQGGYVNGAYLSKSDVHQCG